MKKAKPVAAEELRPEYKREDFGPMPRDSGQPRTLLFWSLKLHERFRTRKRLTMPC